MALSIPQMTRMSQLLDEALPLDAAGRRAWLDSLPPEHRDLAPALREALLPEEAQAANLQAMMTLPKLGAADEAPAASGLQPGARVGPYELIRLLGAGGMAEVWLARRADGAFKREIALKLPMLAHAQAGLEARFARERDILASLEHPYIARLYDAGVGPEGLPYLSMEYVQGEPLTGWSDAHRLGIPERLGLLLQVLEAVQYAHEKQVIHRDLKPSNILVTESGQVRLLDFGVARLLEPDNTDPMELTSLYGRALTPDYASPELLRGDPIDARSDLYSLGVLLYELLTGTRPYRLKRAASIGALDQAIATLEVKRPSLQLEHSAATIRNSTVERLARQLHGDLDAIVLMALAKEPAQRYPSAAAMAEDLRRYLEGKPIRAQPARVIYRLRKFALRNRALLGVSAVALAAILATVGYALYRESRAQVTVSAAATKLVSDKSIAVLPFVDMSEHKDQEYFSDGLSEELIDMLTKIPDLRVPARTSSFYFKGKQASIADIAKALGVAHVLEGSVRKSGNTLRITAQLIRADSGYHVWSETYDRKLDDIFKVQYDIAGAVVRALKVSLLKGEAPNATLTASTEAYDLYLRAQSLNRERSSDDSLKAYANLQHAVSLDPKFALAWASIATLLTDDSIDWTRVFTPGAWTPQGNKDWSSAWAQARAAARAAAEQAIALGPDLGESHRAMADVLEIESDWTAADRELQRARELEPGNARITLAAADMAINLGRINEGLQLAYRAANQDPLGSALTVVLAGQYTSGALDEAQVSAREITELHPTASRSHFMYALILVARGDPQAALSELEREKLAQFRDVGRPIVLDALGRRIEADHAIAVAEDKWANGMAYNIAVIYASRNDSDRAFYWLERAYQQHDGGLAWLKIDPLLGNVRHDPRYKALLLKMRFPV